MHQHHASNLIRELLKTPLKGPERMMMIILAEFSDWANVELSNHRVAELMNVSERQAARLIRSLTDQGYLSRTPGNGRGNVSAYHINTVPYFG